MKNYLIGTLGVVILLLVSVVYKNEMSSCNQFPVLGETGMDSVDMPHLFLYVFLSRRNCPECLGFIDVLNRLPSQFFVFGIVPENEFKDEAELRRLTGATFPLLNAAKYKRKYHPWYSPTIFGVSPGGKTLFVLPGVPGGQEYLEEFLFSFYNKVQPILTTEKSIG